LGKAENLIYDYLHTRFGDVESFQGFMNQSP
jgi:hypothetical protein